MSRGVLLIDDQPADCAAALEALGDSGGVPFQLERVGRLAEGLERIRRDATAAGRQDRIAAIMVELFLPDSRGIDTFDRLFQSAPHIPILVLATARDEPIARLAVQRGAQDYLLKERLDGYSLHKALESMVERAANAEELFAAQELAQVTLNSIGDAVLSVDIAGNVTYLNLVAERMTGWRRGEAAGRPLEEVLRIVNGSTRERVPNPLMLALEQNQAVGLTPDCVLIRRDGAEAGIEDSAAPIHDGRGKITGAVMVFHDVSQARALAVRMAYLAQHDELSGLPNRTLLNDRLSQAMVAAQRHGKKLAVLFLDIDRFKHINDSLGHASGDRLLQAVARRLLACVRNSDTVSRQGGDEFVILLSEVSQAQDAAISAGKILLELSMPYRIDEHQVHVTVSIGIATYPGDGLETHALLKHADIAMYHAKQGGRNNYQFFEWSMNRRVGARQSVESGLRRAIEREEFLLHFQPKVSLRTGEITGVEALVRWRHPEHGVVPAAPFIRVAEESGLIVPIDRWVLEEACRQARAWQDRGLPAVQMAVNVSAADLRDKGFVERVRAALTQTGLQPCRLELELTETLLMEEADVTGKVLHALKDLGVQLAFDDFGTGNASLSALRRLPIDALKIDQSFVRNLTTDAGDAGIVLAMINMGRSLQLRVVAEGVETRRQLTFLQAQGCPEGQGHYFSRPVVEGEFAALLKGGVAKRALTLTRLVALPA
jgi:diguanylate cyclase (GGDEF)-like protein/PAS domain S-box-containing protein